MATVLEAAGRRETTACGIDSVNGTAWLATILFFFFPPLYSLATVRRADAKTQVTDCRGVESFELTTRTKKYLNIIGSRAGRDRKKHLFNRLMSWSVFLRE